MYHVPFRKVIVYQHAYLLSALICISCDALTIAHQLDPRSTIPAPIVIPASNNWDGNDGPWSSFTVQIGTPPQNVNTFLSTASIQTWVVDPQGCASTDPSNCASKRGRVYNYSESTSWIPNLANTSTQIYNLGLESSLNYTGKGRFGFDNITLGYIGSGGPSLQNQTVASIATKEFFLGLFGVKPRSSNFTDFDNPIPSFMQNLRSQSLIPSTSWAYTAGNQYRFNKVLGSLVLGGFDTSKFMPNNITFAFSPADDRELIVQVDRITAGPTDTELLSSSVPMFIDSTIPYIYLPLSACELFEASFGLIWDNTTGLYLLNDTQSAILKSQNPNVTFTLRNLTSPTTFDITLPYSAFDLTASYPLVENATKYFPLKRADNSTQYTLGRTFFQEAYVIADYDRKNFSVSQCKWDAEAVENIVPILAPTNSASASPSQPTRPLPITAIAGAAGGGLLTIVCLIFLFVFLRLKRKKRELIAQREANAVEPRLKAELDAHNELSPKVHEMDPDVDLRELDGDKKLGPWTHVVEIGETGRNKPVYEMAAEEVAVEMFTKSNNYREG